MKALEPCKVVVFDGIKEFRLKLKSLGIDKIVNDDESIKESDVVLILIKEIDRNFVATIIPDFSTFNNINVKMVSSGEIKDIVYIPTIQSIEDFKFDTNKIYYVKAFDEDENEFWLFKPRKENQEKLTEHIGCISIYNGEVDFDAWNGGTIMHNNEIIELREATSKEVQIYIDAYHQRTHRFE